MLQSRMKIRWKTCFLPSGRPRKLVAMRLIELLVGSACAPTRLHLRAHFGT